MSPQNNKIQTTRFMSKGDTKQNWSVNNPILLIREVGYELDTNSYKIGDGVTHWNELPYATIGIKDNDKIILQSNQVYLSNNKKLLTKDDLPTGGDTAGGVGQATADNGEIFNNYEKNKAVGNYSHSEGTDTIAYGNYSHAEGRGINGKESLIEDNEFGSLIELVNRLGGIKIASVIKNENGVESLLEATLTINKYIFDLEGLDELPYECLMEIENNILVPVKNAALISISESDILGNQTARIKFDLYNEKANGITKEQKITNIYSGAAIGEASHSEGYKSNALGKYSHVEGEYTVALGTAAHAEGRQTNAKGNYSHTEGREAQTIGKHSHAEGYRTHAINNNSHAEGSETTANGENSHAEGYGTHAIGKDSHAEGYGTHATGKDSHTEGYNTQANKDRSHAEGNSTQANGKQSHAEGWNAIANGDNSHAEGRSTIANGENSHAEGYNTQANGYASHTEGWNTIASSEYQNVIGKFNVEDYENKYVAAIGNGQPTGRDYDYTTKISTASYSGSLDASKRIATFQPWEYGQEISKGQTPYTMHFGMTVTELTAPLYLEYNYSIDGGAKRTLLTFSNSQVGVGQGFNDSNKIIDVTVPYTINIFMNTIDCDGVIYINDQLLYQGSLRNSSNDIKWREIRVFSLAASENIKFTATDINASIYNNIVSINDAITHYIMDDKALRAPALLNSILPLEQKAIKGYFYKQLENSWAENKVVIENNDDQTYSVQAPNYSNAYTLDWDGNAWFASDVYVGGTNQDDAKKLATEEYVDNKASGGSVDLLNYYTKDEVDKKIASNGNSLIKQAFANENIYDEEKNSVAQGTEYKIGTVFLSGTEKSIIISTEGNKYAYITNIILYDASDVEIADVEIVNKPGSPRSGKKITVPSNARKIIFTYRLSHSSLGTLCAYMMVTIGDTLPRVYVKSKQVNILSDSPYLTESDIGNQNVFYVSSTGSDENNGLSKESPMATISKALALGAKKIAIEVGEYFVNSKIYLSNVNDIRIFAYRNDETYTHSSPIREKAQIIGGKYYTEYTLNADGIYQQNNVTGYDFSNVFINKIKTPNVTERTYHANVMVLHNDKSNDYYLKPVLTYNECVSTDGTFYWDGSTLFFNALSTDFVKIAVINSESVIAIYNCNNVTITDVCFSLCKLSVVDVQNSDRITFENCSADASATSMGFSVVNTNVILNNCYTTKNGYDGFNFHEYGVSVVNDCTAENNYDDGCSHHDGCVGTINGGMFNGNGKAGIAPAYGADVNIYNAVCKDNKIGIGYLTTANGHKNMRGVVSACLMENNETGLIVGKLASVTAISCEYVNNTIDKA